MRNQYSFRFLISPSNPRTDNWVGQAFGLSYLNSQPGNSYLFRFKPYWAAEGRQERGPFLANRSEKPGGEFRTTAFSKRHNDREGHKPETVEYTIRRHMEAIFSRNLIADLDHATALVVEYLNSDLKIEEASIDWVTLAHRVEERQNTLVLTGSLGNRIKMRDEALTLANMMVGHIRRTRNPEALVASLTLADRDQRLHTSMITVDYPRVQKLQEGILPEMKLGTREINGAIFLTGDSYGYRPQVIHDAITKSFDIAERTDHEAFTYTVPDLGITPDKTGAITEYLNGTPVDEREGIRNELRYGDKDIGIGLIYEYPTFGQQPDKTGNVYQTVNASKNHNIDTRIYPMPTYVSNEIRHQSRINWEFTFVTNEASTDARIDMERVDAYGAGTQQARYDLQQITRANYAGFNAYTMFEQLFFEGPDEAPKHGRILDSIALMEHHARGAYSLESHLVDTEKARFGGLDTHVEMVKAEPLQKVSHANWSEIVRSVKLPKGTWVPDEPTIFIDEKYRWSGRTTDQHMELVERDHWNGRIEPTSNVIKMDSVPKDMTYDFADTKVNLIPMDARVLEEASVRVDKTRMQARLIDMVARMDHLWKTSMVLEYFEFIDKVSDNAQVIKYQWAEMKTEKDELDREAIILHVDLLKKAQKESLVDPAPWVHLLADKSFVDGLMLDLLNAVRPDTEALIQTLDFADRVPGGSSAAYIPPSQSLSERHLHETQALTYELTNAERSLEKLQGHIEELLIAYKAEEQRPAYLPVERYLLIGDQSEWEDIWKNYSPGVDILDVPDSDYDYNRLANRVYDPETGVPLKPIGPTNKADVKVAVPLHHPVPSNLDVGIGPVIVDNFVFMDTVLAIESLKNRNQLRYAGMPAEKTMRELLSKLYAWIQQSAPGNAEYERAFRFARWYSEAAVTRLSKHILQRVYKSWVSAIHMNGDLGTDYDSTGWRYISGASVIQTTATHADLSFKKDNYIDGEITVRGYFDNPLGEGTMELKVDGTTIASLGNSDNGVFELKAEVPAGHHTYQIVFNGASGRISLSSLELTGAIFVSASTIADDSDVNGLKACKELITMLLTYFDKHHGKGKIKGTMAIKQRGLWNQT